MTWLSVRVRAPATDREAVLALLFEMGSLGVQEEGDTLATHFAPPFEPGPFAERLRVLSPQSSVDIAETPEVDWNERWRDRIVSHDLGVLTIAPPWLADAENSDRTIVIDPGMAFGTGDHPTTRGVIRLLPHVIRSGDSIADLGAGSAVLSIAAAKLGARRVVAIEMDPDAIHNAEQNVLRNGVSDRVTVIEGDAEVLLPLIGPVHLILVNIISSVITRLLPTMAGALEAGGAAVLGGVLTTERAALTAVLRHDGWTIHEEDVEGDWWSAIVRRA